MVQGINLCVQTHGCLLLCAVVSNGPFQPLRVTKLGVALWCVRVCVCVCEYCVCGWGCGSSGGVVVVCAHWPAPVWFV